MGLDWYVNIKDSEPTYKGNRDFRGNLIIKMYGLPDRFKKTAYCDMSSKEMLEYAKELSDFVKNYKKEDILLPDDDYIIAINIDIIKQAISWLSYWGVLGYSMTADF